MMLWQIWYFIGMTAGVTLFILEVENSTKEVAEKWPEIKRRFREELEKQKDQRYDIYEWFKNR